METKKGSEKHVRGLKLGEFEFPDEILPFEQTRSLWTDHDGSATKVHSFVGKYCVSTGILDVCGISATDDDGTAEINLTDFVCIRTPKAGENFDLIVLPAFFVATARSHTPIYMTSEVSGQNEDILIRVFAWNPSGAPEPNAMFDWHCCVQLLKDIVG